MNFIDRHRRAPRINIRAPPVKSRRSSERSRSGDDRGRRGPQFRREADRIGFERQELAMPPRRFHICRFAPAPTPGAKISQRPQSMRLRIWRCARPMVEVADDGDPPGVRRPDREMHAVDAFDAHDMRAEPFIELAMRRLRREDNRLSRQAPAERHKDRRIPIAPRRSPRAADTDARAFRGVSPSKKPSA